jgi:serine/threonine-protein kinase
MATPTFIGPCEISREIGRGGMGIVYLARDPAISREIGLEVLPADLVVDEATRAKFEREISVFARLEHPHIAPTYGVGLSGRMPFLAMRYLPGGSLENAFDDDTFTDSNLWRAMYQVARALDYAHDEGLVHRDIKPSNILFDDSHNAFVFDFGIAKLVNSASSLTTATSVTSTPTYMSPEQFQKLNYVPPTLPLPTNTPGSRPYP